MFAFQTLANPENLPVWSYFSSQHGLPDERIRSILEEPDGTLVALSINAGLYRFDGKNFLPHPVNRQLPSLFIQTALYDRRGVLWLACNYSGIWFYDRGRVTPAPFNALFDKQHFNTLCADPLGRIWIAVNRAGLFVWDGERCTPVTANYNLPGNDINQLQYFNGALYISYDNLGVYRIQPDQPGQAGIWLEKNEVLFRFLLTGEDQWYEIMDHGSLAFIDHGKKHILRTIASILFPTTDILQDRKGNTWFSVNDTLYRHPVEGQSLECYPIGRSGRLFIDRYQFLWIASDNGVARTRIVEQRSFLFPPETRDHSSLKANFYDNRFFYAGRDGSRWFLNSSGRLLRYQNELVRPFPLPDSLADCHWTAMTQDRKGNYWFAAYPSTLVRWNGRSFSQPIPGDALPAPYITTLYTNSQGELWIGGVSDESIWGSSRTERLIPRLYKNTGTSVPTRLTSLAIDSLGTIWCADSAARLFIGRETSLSLVKFANGAPMLHTILNLRGFAGNVYGTADNGIFQVTPRGQDDFILRLYTTSQSPSLPEPSHPFWLTGRFDHPAAVSRAMTPFGQMTPVEGLYNITSVAAEASALWIATTHTGLWRCTPDTAILIGADQGLTSLMISQLLRTASGDLYVATLDQGLFCLEEGRFRPVECHPPLLSVTALCQEQNGDLLIGTGSGELVTSTPDHLVRSRIRLAEGPVYALTLMSDGRIAAALDNGNFTVIKGTSLLQYDLKALMHNPALRKALGGTRVNYYPGWDHPAHCYSRGLGRWNGKKLELFTIAEGVPGHEIIDFVESRDGRCYVATFNAGLARWADGRFFAERDSNLSRMSRFIRLSAGPDSSLWVLTEDQGAARLKRGIWQVWGSASPFISYKMMDLQLDSRGALIFHDGHGFYYFDEDKLTRLHSSDDIKARKEHAPDFYLDGQNALWYLAGDSCLNVERTDQNAPVTKLTQIQIGPVVYTGEEYLRPLQVNYKEKVCIIDFFGYHAGFPTASLSYSYRVITNGLTGPWQNVTAPRVLFDDLMPGQRYEFQVRSKTPHAHFSRPCGFTLQMDPEPLYRRSGFLATMASLALAGLAAFFIFRYYRIRTLLFRRRFNPYIAGEPVLNSALFFGREEVLDKILGIIHNNNIMVLGERRIGKTSLLKQFALLLQKRDLRFRFFPVYIDLQGVVQEEFFAAMMQDIVEQIPPVRPEVQLLLFKQRELYTYRAFTTDLRTLIDTLAANEKKQVKIVMLIDEADAMNLFEQSVHAQLRRIFMQDVSVNFAAVIAGTYFIRDWNRPESPWWNLFTLMELSALSEHAARDLIQKPVQSIFSYQREAVDSILEITRCKPFAIQMLCLHLIDRMLDLRRRIIHPADVAQAVDDYPQLFRPEPLKE